MLTSNCLLPTLQKCLRVANTFHIFPFQWNPVTQTVECYTKDKSFRQLKLHFCALQVQLILGFASIYQTYLSRSEERIKVVANLFPGTTIFMTFVMLLPYSAKCKDVAALINGLIQFSNHHNSISEVLINKSSKLYHWLRSIAWNRFKIFIPRANTVTIEFWFRFKHQQFLHKMHNIFVLDHSSLCIILYIDCSLVPSLHGIKFRVLGAPRVYDLFFARKHFAISY